MNTYMETPRLILRDWKEEDIPVFAELNSNDQVMEFFLKSYLIRKHSTSIIASGRNSQPEDMGCMQ